MVFARSYIISLLSQIKTGQLRIVDSTGKVTICGKNEPSAGEPQTELIVRDNTFWVQMLLFADMVRPLPSRVYQKTEHI